MSSKLKRKLFDGIGQGLRFVVVYARSTFSLCRRWMHGATVVFENTLKFGGCDPEGYVSTYQHDVPLKMKFGMDQHAMGSFLVCQICRSPYSSCLLTLWLL